MVNYLQKKMYGIEVFKIRRRKGNMFDKTIDSQFINEKKVLQIYEPESFQPNMPYEICIMQDGNDYYQLGRIATLSDQLHESGDLKNTIFVGIHYIDRADRKRKYHPEGSQYEAYMQFLTEEVVPFLDQLYELENKKVGRTLIGDSLAGTIALMGALSYPEIFQKAIIQSPFVDDSVLSRVTFSSNEVKNVYHTIGTNETNVSVFGDEVIDFLTPNRELANMLELKVNDYMYKEIPNGEHTWKYWQNDMKQALITTLS